MRLFIMLIAGSMLFSCKTETAAQNSEANTEETSVEASTKITKKDIEGLIYAEYGLSNVSERNVKNWASYKELESHVSDIKNGNLSFFEGDEKVIAALIKDLKTTMPDNIKSESIDARLIALETKLFKLRSAIKIEQTTQKERLQVVKEFFVAFSNLNLQMNKKFEKEAQNISRSSF